MGLVTPNSLILHFMLDYAVPQPGIDQNMPVGKREIPSNSCEGRHNPDFGEKGENSFWPAGKIRKRVFISFKESYQKASELRGVLGQSLKKSEGIHAILYILGLQVTTN